MIDLSVVIPNLNEEKTIEICIKKALNEISRLGIEGEVLISDNGSTDGSDELAKKAGARVVYCKEKGYGNALKEGIKNAKGKYVIMGDADNTYDFSQIGNFYQKAISDEDIAMVLGSRFKGKIEKGAMPFLHQYIGNPFLTFMINILFKANISDSQCGLRLFKKECYDSIKFNSLGMEFATEIIVEFITNNYKIVEIPTSLSKDAEDRKPHLRTFHDGFRILFYLINKKYRK